MRTDITYTRDRRSKLFLERHAQLHAEVYPPFGRSYSGFLPRKVRHWTRSNSEPCLLATRGKPKRLDAGVRMGIIEKAREHSRKPDCVHGRIERLVAGPYIELFGRAQKPGWTVWGNQTTKFASAV